MRKLVYMIAVVAVAAGITACGTGGQSGNTNGTTVETSKAVEVDLEKVHQAVKAVYGENYIPNMPFDAATLSSLFGLSEDLYEEVIAEGPMISVNVDIFMAVKAKDQKAEAVVQALEAYRKSQMEDAMQYPMNQSKLEASQVVRHGDYVFFLMLGTASDESQEQGQEAALESAKEENQKAVDAVNEFFE